MANSQLVSRPESDEAGAGGDRALKREVLKLKAERDIQKSRGGFNWSTQRALRT
jgi:hypothetical protein